MTISVSAGGEYQQAEGMWVSSGGQWVEVSTGGGSLEPMTLTLVGTPDAGQLQIDYRPPGGGLIPAGVVATLYARYWADRRTVTTNVLQSQTVVPNIESMVLSFSPGAMDGQHQAYKNPNTGWPAAVYHVVISGHPSGDAVTNVLPIMGEVDLSLELCLTGGNQVGITTSTGMVYNITPGTLGTLARLNAYDIEGWLGIMTYSLMTSNIIDITDIPHHQMWEIGPVHDSQVWSRTYSSTGLYRPDTPFVDSAAYPTETLLKRFNNGQVYSKEEFDWVALNGVEFTAHYDDDIGIPAESSEYSGLSAVMLICTATSFTQQGGGVLSLEGEQVVVTGVPGETVSLYWESPVVSPLTGLTTNNITVNKVLDASGRALFGQVDFVSSNRVPMTPANDLTHAPPGKYVLRDYDPGNLIYKNGPIIANVTCFQTYYYAYFDDNLVAYIYNYENKEFQVSTVEYDTYAYRYGVKTVNTVNFAPGWGRGSALDQLGFTSSSASIYLMTSALPVKGAAIPTETLVWSTTTHDPAQLGVLPWPSQLDDPSIYFWGSAAPPNPPLNNAAAWGPTTYIYLHVIVDAQRT